MAKINTEAFELALKFITETNQNIFLTGKAGTGKTTFLKYLKDHSVKSLAVAAPTGVAAINAGGVTLHSLFQLPFGPYIPSNTDITLGYNKRTLLSRLRFNSEKTKLIQSLELLVIDEASMVAAYTVDAIDAVLRFVRRNQKPFGGLQVLFIGDLYQLQPVIKEEESKILQSYYSSNFFFDSLVLRENIPVMIELKTIFRQKDSVFINILNGLRENTLTQEDAAILNSRLNRNFVSQDGDGYITLTTHNHSAKRINEEKLKSIQAPEMIFSANLEGEFPENMYPIEKELLLKEGAQIMFIKNDNESRKFYNGKIGVVSKISDDGIKVESDGEVIWVGKHIWENVAYSVDPATKEIKEELLGTFEQYPLRLAWAITIHKSQGLTFDKVVIDAENAFANGQVYVALSRATSLEGLILTSPVNDRYLGPHQDLKNWTKNKQDEKSLPSLFEKAKLEYGKQLLLDIFSFDKMSVSFERIEKENQDLKENDVIDLWLKKTQSLWRIVSETAGKFRQQLQKLIAEGGISANEKLNSRLTDASNYFHEQLSELQRAVVQHELQVSVRKSARVLEKALEDLNEQIIIALTKIELCRNGFDFAKQSVWRRSLPEEYQKVKSTFKEEKTKGVKSERNELLDLLSDYRKEKALEAGIPPFMVFSTAAIKQCSEVFPGDEETLLSISGFGKHKIKEYGKDVLEIIRNFCFDHNITLSYGLKLPPKTPKPAVFSPTVQETLKHLLNGKSVEEVALLRNMSAETIQGHAATAIRHKTISIEVLMSADEAEKLSQYFSDDDTGVKPAFERAEGKVSYGKLRLVQAWRSLVKME